MLIGIEGGSLVGACTPNAWTIKASLRQTQWMKFFGTNEEILFKDANSLLLRCGPTLPTIMHLYDGGLLLKSVILQVIKAAIEFIPGSIVAFITSREKNDPLFDADFADASFIRKNMQNAGFSFHPKPFVVREDIHSPTMQCIIFIKQ